MLPDFTRAKDRANRDLLRWVGQQTPSVAPLLRRVSTVRQHEGRVGRIVRQDESEASIDFCTTSSEFVQNREDMKHSDAKAIREKLLNAARHIGQDQTRRMVTAAGEAAQSVGNVVDAGGELTPDKFLDLFRKVQMDFDPHTLQPSPGFTFVMHPNTAASVIPKVKEWETDPRFNAEHERILAEKREEWRDREANRKLVD